MTIKFSLAVIAAILIAATLTIPAAATPRGALRLTGDATSADRAWVATASANVPLPPGAVYVARGYSPMWDQEDQILFVPRAGHDGWTADAEHYLLLHELGHVFDARMLNPAERTTFKQLIGSPCQWWSQNCKPPRNPNLSVPPGERFAELYAACALGLTRRQSDDAGYPTYGWDPPVDDRSLCAVFSQFLP